MSGAIVPLLQLAATTDEDEWAVQALAIGERVLDAALAKDGTLRWPSEQWPHGIGGFAHGASGIGWALARLALATGESGFADAAQAAFAFEETLYDQAAGAWLDRRYPDEAEFSAAWCHGAVGIGVGAADLARRGWDGAAAVAGRAAAVATRNRLGWNHTLCHGDLGCWELLSDATAAGLTPPELDRAGLDAQIITSLEDNGPVSGLAANAYSPGLLAGLGGIAYQLLRMHPHSDLPSVLTLDRVMDVG